jgi:hypothetical protein
MAELEVRHGKQPVVSGDIAGAETTWRGPMSNGDRVGADRVMSVLLAIEPDVEADPGRRGAVGRRLRAELAELW